MLMNRTTVFNHIKKLEEEIKVAEGKLVKFSKDNQESYDLTFAELVNLKDEKDRFVRTLQEMVGQ